MDSQDSPRPGRTSPITISAPATARGLVPLTARSAASGRSVQYVGDANPDTLVSSQPNRSANTDTSPAQNGQPSNPSTFDDGTVPPPPTFSRSSAEGEGYASPRGDLPSQDHADPAPSLCHAKSQFGLITQMGVCACYTTRSLTGGIGGF